MFLRFKPLLNCASLIILFNPILQHTNLLALTPQSLHLPFLLFLITFEHRFDFFACNFCLQGFKGIYFFLFCRRLLLVNYWLEHRAVGVEDLIVNRLVSPFDPRLALFLITLSNLSQLRLICFIFYSCLNYGLYLFLGILNYLVGLFLLCLEQSDARM